MKRKRGWILGLLSIVLVIGYACQDQAIPANSEETDGFNLQKAEGKALSSSPNHSQRNFRTHLKGDNEVPAVETNAQGQAIFKVSKDGNSIQYKLIVANIENVFMAHIHNAPAGQNGGIVVWLYPSAPPPQLIPGRSQGILAEGTITADNLMGTLAGQTIADLVELIESGEAYVNVHTDQNPGGEVRGQIQ